jgi:magnesium transporter
MISILGYHNNRLKQLTIPELFILRSSPEFDDWNIWVDLSTPSEEEEETILIHLFLFHHLAVEDCQRERLNPEQGDHFPKVEDYENYLFVIFNPVDIPTEARALQYEEEDEEEARARRLRFTFRTQQINSFLGANYIVTHHYEPSPSIESTQQLCEKNPNLLSRGPDYLFHVVIDQIVDQYAPVMEHFDDVLEDVESEVLSSNRTTLLVEILSLKKDIQRLKRITTYQREILSRLARGEFRLISLEEMAYYRNVYDHLVRIVDIVESYKDVIAGMVDAHLSVTSNRMNAIMKVLTMMSTFFMPLTLITGLYGMNFEFMPELRWKYGYLFAIGMMASVATVFVIYFKRKGWFD